MYYPKGMDEGMGKPCAVDRVSQNISTHSVLNPGFTVQGINHYSTVAISCNKVDGAIRPLPSHGH